MRPTTSTVGRSQGIQSALRPSSTADHSTVANEVTARAPAAYGLVRRRHSSTTPMPTRAPIAGARATV